MTLYNLLSNSTRTGFGSIHPVSSYTIAGFLFAARIHPPSIGILSQFGCVLSTFSDLLSSTSDGIEVSYNACGVLAHVMADGPEVWTVSDPLRSTVMENMEQAIARWDIMSKRNINYRQRLTFSVVYSLFCIIIYQVIHFNQLTLASDQVA